MLFQICQVVQVAAETWAFLNLLWAIDLLILAYQFNLFTRQSEWNIPREMVEMEQQWRCSMVKQPISASTCPGAAKHWQVISLTYIDNAVRVVSSPALASRGAYFELIFSSSTILVIVGLFAWLSSTHLNAILMHLWTSSNSSVDIVFCRTLLDQCSVTCNHGNKGATGGGKTKLGIIKN